MHTYKFNQNKLLYFRTVPLCCMRTTSNVFLKLFVDAFATNIYKYNFLASIRKKLMKCTFKQIVYLAHFHHVCPPSVPTNQENFLFVFVEAWSAGGNFIYKLGEFPSSDSDKQFFCCASIYIFIFS